MVSRDFFVAIMTGTFGHPDLVGLAMVGLTCGECTGRIIQGNHIYIQDAIEGWVLHFFSSRVSKRVHHVFFSGASIFVAVRT